MHEISCYFKGLSYFPSFKRPEKKLNNSIDISSPITSKEVIRRDKQMKNIFHVISSIKYKLFLCIIFLSLDFLKEQIIFYFIYMYNYLT